MDRLTLINFSHENSSPAVSGKAATQPWQYRSLYWLQYINNNEFCPCAIKMRSINMYVLVFMCICRKIKCHCHILHFIVSFWVINKWNTELFSQISGYLGATTAFNPFFRNKYFPKLQSLNLYSDSSNFEHSKSKRTKYIVLSWVSSFTLSLSRLDRWDSLIRPRTCRHASLWQHITWFLCTLDGWRSIGVVAMVTGKTLASN